MHRPTAIAAAVALLSLTPSLPAAAQAPVEKLRIRMTRGGLTGTEEYRLEKTADGHRLTGTIRVEQAGVSMESTHELNLDAAWGLRSYRLTAARPNQTQVVSADRMEDQIRMRVDAGGKETTRPAPFRPETVILDNLVTSHYQILLNRIAATAAPAPAWSVVVPQALASINAQLEGPEAARGKCQGEPCDLQKYSLRLANVLVEFWAEKGTNRLMRMAVPLQNLEVVRDGYEPAEAPGAAPTAQGAEREVRIQSGGLELPGTLALPAAAAGRVPVVVLVHGSGPQDRDETIGPNKPFRDLAGGLAAKGIASLRYDKRTFAHKQRVDPKKVTIEEEVLADAVAALELARALPEVDSSSVFLLGHSLGGSMAPFIAERVPSLAGLILLAAAARPLDQLIYEQVAFAMKLGGSPASDIEEKLAGLKRSFARVRSGQAPDDEIVLGAPGRYWRTLFGMDVEAALSKCRKPVLVLQGGKDVQVGRTDFELIRKALAGRPSRQQEFHWMEDLNHLFVRVEGEPTAAEYGKAGSVDPRVTETIAAWIGSVAKSR